MTKQVFKNAESFSHLLSLNLESFETFLENCTHQTEIMKNVKRRKWPYKKNYFYSMGRSMNISEIQMVMKAGMQATEQEEKEGLVEYSRVLTRIVDMDRIFDQEFALNFI